MAVGVICDGLHGQSFFVGLAVVLKAASPGLVVLVSLPPLAVRAALLPNDSFPLSRLTSQPFKGQKVGVNDYEASSG